MSQYIAGPVPLPDGRAAWVIPLTFGRARIVIGQPDSSFLDDGW